MRIDFLRIFPTKESRYVFAFMLISLIGLAGLTLTFYNKFQKSKPIPQSILTAPQAKPQTIIESVAKLIEVPAEEPAVATITDSSRLEQNTLYKNAANGDKIVIYEQAKKAILYRPSSNKIIAVETVEFDSKAITDQQNGILGQASQSGQVVEAPQQDHPRKVLIAPQ